MKVFPLIFLAQSFTQDTVNLEVCKADTCTNGCTCEESCRDELSYFCRMQRDSPWIGKQCDWAVDFTCEGSCMRMAIPVGFMAEMEQTVKNGIIHMCDAEGYICPRNDACEFRLEDDFYVFDSCQESNRLCDQVKIVNDSEGSFFTTSTAVWDRNSTYIRMPRPLKILSCHFVVQNVEAGIFPKITPIGQVIHDRPVEISMTLWKTKFDVWPGIPATLAELPSGLSYIIGEVIHARLQPVLPLQDHIALPEERVNFSLNKCWIVRRGAEDERYLIISDNAVVSDAIVPVQIEHAPTFYVGKDEDFNAKQALAFNFQVGIFKNGDPMKVICETTLKFDEVRIIQARRRRADEIETQLVEQEFLVYHNVNETIEEGLIELNDNTIKEEEKGSINYASKLSKLYTPTLNINFDKPEWRAIAQPTEYISETLPKENELPMVLEELEESYGLEGVDSDTVDDENNDDGSPLFETLVILPLVSVCVILWRVYRVYRVFENCTDPNGLKPVPHNEYKEEYASSVTEDSSLDSRIHFHHEDKKILSY